MVYSVGAGRAEIQLLMSAGIWQKRSIFMRILRALRRLCKQRKQKPFRAGDNVPFSFSFFRCDLAKVEAGAKRMRSRPYLEPYLSAILRFLWVAFCFCRRRLLFSRDSDLGDKFSVLIQCLTGWRLGLEHESSGLARDLFPTTHDRKDFEIV